MSSEVREKVMSYLDVPSEELPEEMASKATIRWLITRKDGARNFAMRYFSIEPGGVIRPHSHPWEHEIFIVRGEGVVRIGEETYQVKPGHFLFIPPDAEHSYEATGQEPLEFICVIPDEGY